LLPESNVGHARTASDFAKGKRTRQSLDEKMRRAARWTVLRASP